MKIDINHFKTMESYTFEEGVAFLALCNVSRGVVRHITATHNRSHLHSEIHKTLRMPGIMRLLKEKGHVRETAIQAPEPASNSSEIHGTDTATPESGTEPTDNVPETHETGTLDESETLPDWSDIIITTEDVRTHKYTTLEQMPNELTRKLWLEKQDKYREMQQNHLKMRNVPEGDEHDEERARYRAEVLRLDGEVEAYWDQIDTEIERFFAEGESHKEDNPAFKVSTYRAYISKAVRKKELTPAQLAELQHRVDAMLAAKEELEAETIEKLKAKGIKVG